MKPQVSGRDGKDKPGDGAQSCLNSGMFLSEFDGQSRLLLRSLMSGASRALGVFHRQQRANPESSLCGFIETLCRDEITHTEADTEFLTV